MTDAQVLRTYRWAVKEVAALRQQVDHLERQLGPAGVATISFWEESRATNNRSAAIVQALSGVEAQLLEKAERLAQQVARFDRIVSAEPDPLTRQVLRLYYACGETDQRIADTLGYSVRAVNYTRNKWLHLHEREGVAHREVNCG